MRVKEPGKAALRCLPVQTTWGWLAPVSGGAGIVRCCLPEHSAQSALERVRGGGEVIAVEPGECAELDLAAEVLLRYFRGEPVDFEVALDLSEVTAFSARVLAECNRIAYGDTSSYGELAARVGSPRAARAVGQVMRRNPLAPLVPCHRVVGSDGSLTGYGGGLEMKRRLLKTEAAVGVQQFGWTATDGVYSEDR